MSSPLSRARSVSTPPGWASSPPAIPPPPDPNYEELPTELRGIVLESLGDLATLCSLMYASPRTRSLFYDNPARCVDANVWSGKGSDIHDLVRIFIAIRLSQFKYQSLTEFHQECVSKIGEDTGEDLFPPIPTDLPADKYYDIVLTAYRVWWHTQCCLKYYMDIFMNLKPQLPTNVSFQYGPSSSRPWRRTPQTYRCSTYHAGPPSASEEHHVARAFWRLQVEYELQNSINEGNIEWAPDSVQYILPVDRSFLWGDEENDPSTAIMDTILNYLEATLQNPRSSPVANSSSHLQRLPRPIEDIPINWPEREDIDLSRQCESDQLTRHPQPGLEFWALLQGDSCSPLPSVWLDPFLELGFAIWDLQRFCALGLLRPSEFIWHSEAARHGMYCAWRSIMRADDLAENDLKSDEAQDVIDQREAGRRSFGQ